MGPLIQRDHQVQDLSVRSDHIQSSPLQEEGMLKKIWDNYLPELIFVGSLALGKKFVRPAAMRAAHRSSPGLSRTLSGLKREEQVLSRVREPASDQFLESFYSDSIRSAVTQQRIHRINSVASGNVHFTLARRDLSRVEEREWLIGQAIGHLEKPIQDLPKLIDLSKSILFPQNWKLHFIRSKVDKSVIAELEANQLRLIKSQAERAEKLPGEIKTATDAFEKRQQAYEKGFKFASYFFSILIGTGLSCYRDSDKATERDLIEGIDATVARTTEEFLQPKVQRLQEAGEEIPPISGEIVKAAEESTRLTSSKWEKRAKEELAETLKPIIAEFRQEVEKNLNETLKECSEEDREIFKQNAEALLQNIIGNIVSQQEESISEMAKTYEKLSQFPQSNLMPKSLDLAIRFTGKLLTTTAGLFLAGSIGKLSMAKRMIQLIARTGIPKKMLEKVLLGISSMTLIELSQPKAITAQNIHQREVLIEVIKHLDLEPAQISEDQLDKLPPEIAKIILGTFLKVIFSSFPEEELTELVEALSLSISSTMFEDRIQQPLTKEELKEKLSEIFKPLESLQIPQLNKNPLEEAKLVIQTEAERLAAESMMPKEAESSLEEMSQPAGGEILPPSSPSDDYSITGVIIDAASYAVKEAAVRVAGYVIERGLSYLLRSVIS